MDGGVGDVLEVAGQDGALPRGALLGCGGGEPVRRSERVGRPDPLRAGGVVVEGCERSPEAATVVDEPVGDGAAQAGQGRRGSCGRRREPVGGIPERRREGQRPAVFDDPGQGVRYVGEGV